MKRSPNGLARARNLQRFDKPPVPPVPLTATAKVYGGPGLGLVEIQATIEPPHHTKGKILAVGVPRGEVDQIFTTILKIPGLLGHPDYSVTCRLVGGEKYQSAFGVGLTVALISSYLRKPIQDDFVFIGEIDLHRQVRGGSPRLIENMRRSVESSEVSFNVSLVLPASANAQSLDRLGVRLWPCATILDVVTAVWARDDDLCEKIRGET